MFDEFSVQALDPFLPFAHLFFVFMASWWTSGKPGYLPPVEQAKLWGLTMMADEFDMKLPAHKIMSLFKKVGGGHPSERAIQAWRLVFREDPDWYPGKTTEEGEKTGPKPVFTALKKQAVANSAMALKRAGIEPTVAEVRQRCPQATLNPVTQQPFTDKYTRMPRHMAI